MNAKTVCEKYFQSIEIETGFYWGAASYSSYPLVLATCTLSLIHKQDSRTVIHHTSISAVDMDSS